MNSQNVVQFFIEVLLAAIALRNISFFLKDYGIHPFDPNYRLHDLNLARLTKALVSLLLPPPVAILDAPFPFVQLDAKVDAFMKTSSN